MQRKPGGTETPDQPQRDAGAGGDTKAQETAPPPNPSGAIRSTFLLTFAEILLNLVLVGQNRFLAVQIGPAGFGVYGLLQSIFRFVSSFSSAWLSVPVTKWIAEYDADDDKRRRDNTFSLSLSLTLAILIPASVGFAVFHRPIIDTFMNGEVRVLHFFLFMAFAALTALRTVQSAILQGLLLIKRIVQVRVVTAVVQLALILALVNLFKLTGFFTALVAGLAVATTLAFWVMRADGHLDFVRPRPRSLESRRLLEFGGANLALMFVALGTEYAQRFIVLRAHGIESVGFMVAAIQIVTYMDVANRSAMFYWLPKMSRSGSGAGIIDDYARFSHFNLYAGIPAVLGGILFGGLLIDILLGAKFAPLTSALYLFMIWQFLNLIHNPPAMAIMALAQVRIHTLASLASGITVPLVLLILIDRMGLEAVGIALIAGGVVAYVPRFVYVGRVNRLWGDIRSWGLAAFGVLVVAAGFFARDWAFGWRVVLWMGVVSTLFGSMPVDDRREIVAAVGAAFGRARWFRRKGKPA